MNANLLALILIFLAGAVLVLGALLNWSLFNQTKTSTYINEKFGEGKSRLIYLILGLFVILMGIFAVYNGFLEDPLQ
jgi:hypothetical protein